MLGRSRIGLAAVLGAALLALGASPAYAATKKAGTITSGGTATLLNTSGFAKITLDCHDNDTQLHVFALGAPLDIWFDYKGNTTYGRETSAGNGSEDQTVDKPGHLEWSLALNSKLLFGQVYVARTGTAGNDCRYNSQIS